MAINQNLNQLMKEAEKMQKLMQETQQQLDKLIVHGEAGGGIVKVSMNGRHDVTKVTIDENLFKREDYPGNEYLRMLEDLSAAAFNDAVRKIEKISKDKISKLTAGFNISADMKGNDE